jgi:general secretion pathway protein H
MNRFRDQGFTLLELIIVVLLISLALAVTYPSLSRVTTSIRLRSTARDILNTFRTAREKAVTEQAGMQVLVDRVKQELVLSDDLGDGVRRYRLPEDVRIHSIVSGGTEITDGPLVVRFLPNGSAQNAEVLLESKTGGHLKIVTDPITGGARIESAENTR